MRFGWERFGWEKSLTSDGQGGYWSHFGLDLTAMEECGADCAATQAWLNELERRASVEEALSPVVLPKAAAPFVRTLRAIALAAPPWSVAAFLYGREAIIPDRFRDLREYLGPSAPVQPFRCYLRRHMAVDASEHGPLAAELLQALIGGDPARGRSSGDCRARLGSADRLVGRGGGRDSGSPRHRLGKTRHASMPGRRLHTAPVPVGPGWVAVGKRRPSFGCADVARLATRSGGVAAIGADGGRRMALALTWAANPRCRPSESPTEHGAQQSQRR
ncbi:MAG: DUF3050 domain-containing protein [Firmicutes bacterium]|nr:DUF3050 domain-containing protein [Alicyclobacillaceae bacterium]MCL6497002.1 DUF3050 domain-containing protein [Bacillota bacterium]